MSEKQQVLLPPSEELSSKAKEGETITSTAKQDGMVKEVLAHFEREEYTLPGAEEGDGALKEVEKYWLVSLPYIAIVCLA